PTPGWEAITITGRAKSAQRRMERLARRGEFVRLGREFVAAALRRHGIDLDEVDMSGAAEKLDLPSTEDLFEAVGEKRLSASQAAIAAFPGLAETIQREEARTPLENRRAQLFVQGAGLTPGVALHFSGCCSPIPGDRIVGVHREGLGVEIHTLDCERLSGLEADGDWIDLAWTQEARERALAVGRIQATVENGRGVLAALARIIGEHEGDILNVRTLRRSREFFDLVFDVEVADVRHLANILAAMRASRFVREADRVRN
ncbi:MAG: bifunctional (p)ppGpp synthetase/guanosine-3',5'-bis(diphosphate) 3'-pyrophosphohydrolase, partial [Hyphomonadaceae bacterium]|nr:bifunctional (p)ppGpp synthetase/guanosine-3',5'-bis(diphosphate) 3'-pyrophosphohydrolase [Hyphomonadaceae bacterium]